MFPDHISIDYAASKDSIISHSLHYDSLMIISHPLKIISHPLQNNERSPNPLCLSKQEPLPTSADFLNEMNQRLNSDPALQQMLEQRQQLPVANHKDEILQAVRENQVVIIRGATGCGKTTQVFISFKNIYICHIQKIYHSSKTQIFDFGFKGELNPKIKFVLFERTLKITE